LKYFLKDAEDAETTYATVEARSESAAWKKVAKFLTDEEFGDYTPQTARMDYRLEPAVTIGGRNVAKTARGALGRLRSRIRIRRRLTA